MKDHCGHKQTLTCRYIICCSHSITQDTHTCTPHTVPVSPLHPSSTMYYRTHNAPLLSKTTAHLCHESSHLQSQLLVDREVSLVDLVIHLVGQQEALTLCLSFSLGPETQPTQQTSHWSTHDVSSWSSSLWMESTKTRSILPALVHQTDDACALVFPRMQFFQGLFPLGDDITDLLAGVRGQSVNRQTLVPRTLFPNYSLTREVVCAAIHGQLQS